MGIGQYGMFCTIRKSTTSGRGIYGACGQLALKGNHVQDIEDMMHSNSNKNIKKLSRKKKKTKTKNKTNDNFFNLNRLNARNMFIGSAMMMLLVLAGSYFVHSSKRSNLKTKKMSL